MTNPYLDERWTIQRAFGRAGTILREAGPRSLFFKVAGELVYRRLLMDELRFEDVNLSGTFGGHELVELERSRFAEYLRFRTDLDEARIEARLGRGHECHAIVVDGEVAQTCWVAPGRPVRVGYLGCEIELGERDVYVYEFLVHPSYRRRKLSPAALSGLIRVFRSRKYERILWAWMPENARGVAVVRQWPFRTLGVLGYWRIAGWRKYFSSIPEAERPPYLASEELMRWHQWEPEPRGSGG